MGNLKTMRVFSADREKRSKRIMRNEGDWDGIYPIPMSYQGGITIGELTKLSDIDEDFDLIQCSGDDMCFWCGNAITASLLFICGHNFVSNPDVLAKRETFKH